jgi:hypothetical protein
MLCATDTASQPRLRPPLPWITPEYRGPARLHSIRRFIVTLTTRMRGAARSPGVPRHERNRPTYDQMEPRTTDSPDM